jgi:tetratricopeptide (TPR) repeat protein
MTSKPLHMFNRGLSISLMAAMALLPVPKSFANPGIGAQHPASQGSNQPDLSAMIEQADKHRINGNYGAAAAIWQQILAIVEKALGVDHPDVALSLNNLAQLLISQGQYAAAEPLLRRSLAIYEKALGPDHPYVATRDRKSTRLNSSH